MRWPAAGFEAVICIEKGIMGIPECAFVKVAGLIEVVIDKKGGHFEA